MSSSLATRTKKSPVVSTTTGLFIIPLSKADISHVWNVGGMYIFFNGSQRTFKAGLLCKKLAETGIFEEFVLPFLVICNLPISTVFCKSGTGGFQANLTILSTQMTLGLDKCDLFKNEESLILGSEIWMISIILTSDHLLLNLSLPTPEIARYRLIFSM